MKVLVTGSNGFIGSALVEKLIAQNHEVVCLVRRTSNMRWLTGLPIAAVTADLESGTGLQAALQGLDWVFHLAGVTKALDQQGYWDGNVLATENLLKACLHQSRLKKFVYVSSQAAAGPSIADQPLTEEIVPHPVSLYGKSKEAAEKLVLEYGAHFPVTIVRPPSVYGPRDRDVFVYFQNVNKGLLLILGKGTQKISIVHVHDLVDGMVLAAEKPNSSNQIYFLSGDGAFDWQTIGGMIASALQKKTWTIHVPVSMLQIASRISVAYGRLIGKPALLNGDKVSEMVQPGWLCSNEKAKKELGFAPAVSLPEGLKQTATWYKQQGWL
jgi:nucleoside-diphosphate-sugar epimerase